MKTAKDLVKEFQGILGANKACFRHCTGHLYVLATGKSSDQLRRELCLGAKDSIIDCLSSEELGRIKSIVEIFITIVESKQTLLNSKDICLYLTDAYNITLLRTLKNKLATNDEVM